MSAADSAGDHTFGYFSPPRVIELLSTPADPSFRPGGSEARRRPLADHRPLELGEGSDHLHHHPAGRGGGVDVLGNGTEARARGADPLHDVQHVLERARQAVELPDDDGIALAQMVEQSMQLWPIPTPAGRGLLEQAFATGGFERFRLQGRRRFGDLELDPKERHPGIPDFLRWQQPLRERVCSERRLFQDEFHADACRQRARLSDLLDHALVI
jgi:hypothetical protein